MYRQIIEYRACKILYNFIVSNHMSGLVAMPVNICSDVVDTIKVAGLVPYFLDIDSQTLCLDEIELMRISKDVQMLIYVHTYGLDNTVDMTFRKLHSINPSIIIVDDRCLCKYSQVINTESDVVLFSTGPRKMVDLGMGGIAYIDDKWKYETQIDNSGFLTESFWVFNEEEYLKRETEVLNHKSILNQIYLSELPAQIKLPEEYQSWRFNIFVDNKKHILDTLFSANLFAGGHYKPICSGCKNADYLYEHVINLFNDQYYTEEQALKTCEIINRELSRR